MLFSNLDPRSIVYTKNYNYNNTDGVHPMSTFLWHFTAFSPQTPGYTKVSKSSEYFIAIYRWSTKCQFMRILIFECPFIPLSRWHKNSKIDTLYQSQIMRKNRWLGSRVLTNFDTRTIFTTVMLFVHPYRPEGLSLNNAKLWETERFGSRWPCLFVWCPKQISCCVYVLKLFSNEIAAVQFFFWIDRSLLRVTK
jgi:hypothetical protein